MSASTQDPSARPRVLILCADPDWRARAQAHLQPLARLEAADVSGVDVSGAAMLVVDLDGADPDPEARRRRQEALVPALAAMCGANPELRVALVTDRRRRPELLDALSLGFSVDHLIPRGEPTTWDELAWAVRRAQGASEGVGALLGVEGVMTAMTLTDSAQKDEALQALASHCDQRGVQPRIAAMAQAAADELIVNAIYNAPVDASGRHLFLNRDRRQGVSLTAAQAVTFSFGATDEHLLVAARDPFGSLSPDTVRRYLQRTLRGGDDQIEHKSGGAGLGMLTMVESVNKLFFCVDPGRATEVVCALTLGGSFRAFASRPKSIHLG